MTDAAGVAQRYIAFWNEADPDHRRALFSRDWTEDAHFADPRTDARGFQAIDAVVAAVQAQFAGFRFRLRGAADGFGDHVRFSWIFGPGTEAVAEGTDFALLDSGRLKSVTGFFDKLPG